MKDRISEKSVIDLLLVLSLFVTSRSGCYWLKLKEQNCKELGLEKQSE
jgi:hypothetical protein